jgi:hypothetical protein
MHDETQDQVEKPPSTTTIEQNKSAPRTSNRFKKTPATMSEDFLDNRLFKTSTLGASVICGLSKKLVQWVSGGVGCELVAHPSTSLHSTGPT